mmetsp:Transcript_285/g.932  ORF Transcript_285/g.932 Transcript_285/m.932 type:complete len:315 (+) Transcript_285:75-1019(+)
MHALARQCTISAEAAFKGVGIHSGRSCCVTVKPAPVDRGIVFRHVQHQGCIPCEVTSVFSTNLCTVLAPNVPTRIHDSGLSGWLLRRWFTPPWRVSTVEHLLAAIAGLGVENVTVEVDGPEVPILDGSSEVFVNTLADLLTFQPAQRPQPRIEVVREVRVESDGGSRWAMLSPSGENDSVDDFRISVSIEFAGEVELQKFSFLRSEFVSSGTYRARTFGFAKDLPMLRRSGLASGATLNNAVLVDRGTVANKSGLRFKEELAMHKGLDCLGDMRLGGQFVRTNYTAHKPGHGLNFRLLRRLFQERSNFRTLCPN